MSDVVVVGAGAFGAWTAHYLTDAGARVTLLDAYGPGNSRSSSGDESRILRCGYGADEIYSRFAGRSRAQWRQLDARRQSDLPLWHPCGVLWLAGDDDPYTAETRATLQRAEEPTEIVHRADLRARYPHLQADDLASAMLEIEGGAIMARRAIQTLTAELSRKGVRIRHGRAAMPREIGRVRLQQDRKVSAVHLSEGTDVAGDAFVFACGAWLPTVFPELLGQRIMPTRQVVIYFGAPPGDDRFSAAHTPAWVDFAHGIYGVPDLEDRGLKIGIDTHGPPFDPDTGDRRIDGESVERARAWLRRRFPAMADAPLVESRVCQYENTSTGDFLIDRHPDHENVWIAGGGSGHGFKHGPAVGEYVTRLITRGEAPDARFSLTTKGTAARREVY